MASLNDVMKAINKKYEVNVARFGVESKTSSATLSLGSPALDFCLYNSIVEGKFIELNGLESSGKTTASFLIAASYIRNEKKRNPDNPRKILFIDAECTLDPDWAIKSTGYDPNDKDVPTIYVGGCGQSAEQYFDIVRDCVATGEIGLVIFDSLTMLASQQVNSESMTQKDMGGIAKPLGDFCKRTVGLFNRYKTTFIGINGLTENISGYGDPLITPGGKTWKRTCMWRLRFKRGSFFDENGNEVKKSDANSPAGHIIEMYVEKTKSCPWDRKLGMMHLNYSKGIDLLWDTIDIATFFGMIVDTGASYFNIIDVDTGEILASKVHGKKNVRAYLESHTDVWRKMYDKVYEKMSVQDDPYQVSFEKMLGIDVNERLGINLDELQSDEQI